MLEVVVASAGQVTLEVRQVVDDHYTLVAVFRPLNNAGVVFVALVRGNLE